MKTEKVIMRNLEAFLNRRKIKDIGHWIQTQNFMSLEDLARFCSSQNIRFEPNEYSHYFSTLVEPEIDTFVNEPESALTDDLFIPSEDEPEIHSLADEQASFVEVERVEDNSELLSTDDTSLTSDPEFSRKSTYKKNKKKN